MKTVGIIGGLGPETTAEFYRELIFARKVLNSIQRPPMLIWNVPVTYKLEESAIAHGRDEDKFIPLLVDAAKRLEKGGADFLVMPCNTLHTHIKDMRDAVNIPVLSVVEETASFLRRNHVSSVGILATSITLRTKIYENELSKNKIKQVVPDGFQQAKIGKIIHNLVANRPSNKDRDELAQIIDSFSERYIRNIILACTDLQLLVPNHPKLQIYDTMKILADATVDYILKK